MVGAAARWGSWRGGGRGVALQLAQEAVDQVLTQNEPSTSQLDLLGLLTEICIRAPDSHFTLQGSP